MPSAPPPARGSPHAARSAPAAGRQTARLGSGAWNRSSIVVHGPQPGLQPQKPLNTFIFVEPVLGHVGQQYFAAMHDADRATRSSLLGHHLPVLAQRPLTKAGNLTAILTEEHQHRHAIAA